MLSGDEILKLEEFYHIFSFEPNFQVVAKLDGMRFIIHPNPDKPEKFFCISSKFQVQ